MDSLDSIIEIVLVVIFIIGQFLWQIFKSKFTKQQTSTAPLPTASEEAHRGYEDDYDDELEELEEYGVANEHGPSGDEQGSAHLAGAKIDEHHIATLELLLERAQTLSTNCSYRNFDTAQKIAELYVTTIERVLKKYKSLVGSQTLGAHSAKEFEHIIYQIDERLSYIEHSVSKRSSSDASNFRGLDKLAGELLAPYYSIGMIGNYPMYTVFPLVETQHREDEDLVGIYTEENTVPNMRRWITLGVDVATTLWEKDERFGSKMVHDLGLPSSSSSMAYFVSSGQLMTAGLISGWLKWLFCDCAAVLQMGEMYTIEQLNYFEKKSDELYSCSINEYGIIISAPLIIRLAGMNAILIEMGSAQSKHFSERFSKLVKAQTEMTLVFKNKTKMSVSIELDSVLGDVYNVSKALVNTRLSSLNNNSLSDLLSPNRNLAPLPVCEEISEQLVQGHTPQSSSVKALIQAMAVAVLEHGQLESRIASTVQKALMKTNVSIKPEKQISLDSKNKLSKNKLEDMFTKEQLPTVMMIQALAKSRR